MLLEGSVGAGVRSRESRVGGHISVLPHIDAQQYGCLQDHGSAELSLGIASTPRALRTWKASLGPWYCLATFYSPHCRNFAANQNPRSRNPVWHRGVGKEGRQIPGYSLASQSSPNSELQMK